MARHWIIGDGNALDSTSDPALGHSVISSIDVISRGIPRIKPANPKSEMAVGQTCNVAYYKQLPSVLKFWRKTILNPLKVGPQKSPSNSPTAAAAVFMMRFTGLFVSSWLCTSMMTQSWHCCVAHAGAEDVQHGDTEP